MVQPRQPQHAPPRPQHRVLRLQQHVGARRGTTCHEGAPLSTVPPPIFRKHGGRPGVDKGAGGGGVPEGESGPDGGHVVRGSRGGCRKQDVGPGAGARGGRSSFCISIHPGHNVEAGQAGVGGGRVCLADDSSSRVGCRPACSHQPSQHAWSNDQQVVWRACGRQRPHGGGGGRGGRVGRGRCSVPARARGGGRRGEGGGRPRRGVCVCVATPERRWGRARGALGGAGKGREGVERMRVEAPDPLSITPHSAVFGCENTNVNQLVLQTTIPPLYARLLHAITATTAAPTATPAAHHATVDGRTPSTTRRATVGAAGGHAAHTMPRATRTSRVRSDARS